MTVCLLGGPKFVCKMIPVRQLDSQFLFQEAQNLISTLQNAGEVAVAITSDGNQVNQSFFHLFDTKYCVVRNVFLFTGHGRLD